MFHLMKTVFILFFKKLVTHMDSWTRNMDSTQRPTLVKSMVSACHLESTVMSQSFRKSKFYHKVARSKHFSQCFWNLVPQPFPIRSWESKQFGSNIQVHKQFMLKFELLRSIMQRHPVVVHLYTRPKILKVH